MNLIVSTSVQGTINLRVEDRTPKEVIQIICQANDLTLHELNAVFFVSPWDESLKKDAERIAHIAKIQFDAYIAKGFTRPEALELVCRAPDAVKLPTLDLSQKTSVSKRSPK